MLDTPIVLAITFGFLSGSICLIAYVHIYKLKSQLAKADEDFYSEHAAVLDAKSDLDKLKLELQELKSKPKKEVMSIEAQQILHDMTRGEAIVRIVPINPADVFWRSPR